jgi:hypothetical protein
MAIASPPPRMPRPRRQEGGGGFPPAPARPAAEGAPYGRRLAPAGHALVVLVIALVLVTFLNAKGMRKTAHEQPPGAPRDVAVALTGGLSAVSGFFQLDEPRRGVQALLGRLDEDRISTRVIFAQRHARPRAARPAAKPIYSAARPLRLYLTGDSLMADPAKVLLEQVQGDAAFASVGPVDTHAATGLAQPLAFNWFEYLPGRVRALRPGLVVLGFGGNDGQDLFGDGGGEHFGTPEWSREYARRVGGIMDDFVSRGTKVVWCGLPIPRDPDLADRFRVMNAAYAQEAARRKGDVVYLDLYRRFADRKGHYADYLPDGSGQLIRMRKPDGIHYELAGAEVVATEVLSHLDELVTLRSAQGP